MEDSVYEEMSSDDVISQFNLPSFRLTREDLVDVDLLLKALDEDIRKWEFNNERHER